MTLISLHKKWSDVNNGENVTWIIVNRQIQNPATDTKYIKSDETLTDSVKKYF